jgi:ABC-type Zn uptake system ZnuABC Zn-binding protein ZnuA
LEEALLPVLTTQGSHAVLVSVNAGLTLRTLGADKEHGGVDPHTWTSVPNVQQWVKNIAQVLTALDPANQTDYQAAATVYAKELNRLEGEITASLATIPQAKRKLVTDHEVFGYFADHYGFTIVGTVTPGLSTLASPSAQELAALQDQIKAEQVPAIFVGTTASPALATQLASDLGIKVVPLYAESLSAPDGPAPTYLDFMRYTVAAIVAALK